MSPYSELWIVPVVAALSLQLGGCLDSSTSRPSSVRAEEPSAAADYVLLRDDDRDPDQVQGRAGSYALTARGQGSPPLAVLDVPEGFSNFGFFALWPSGSGDGGSEDEAFRAVQYWTVHAVFPDPCDGKGPAAEVGGSVEELADALASQRTSSTSVPQEVVLDGHPGLYLELTIPSDVEVEDCEGGYYDIWEAAPGDAQHTASAPGSVEHAWILQVGSERVVLLAITDPGVTDAQADDLTTMVESVRFVEPE